MRHGRLSRIIGSALLASLAVPFMGLAQQQAQGHLRKSRNRALIHSETLPGGSPPLVAGTPSQCASMTALIIPNTQITSAQVVPASDDLPEYCSVIGVVAPTAIFEVRLPTNWNQKLYFAGNGAFAGSFSDIEGEVSSGLSRGYATAATDTGHEADIWDASWALNNRPAEIDYGYRALHLTVRVAKIVIASYYGQGPNLSYFDGCSKGGEQGLLEAQQYPQDFDGIAAGAPALDFTGFLTAANWNMQALLATANSSDMPFEKVLVVGAAVLAKCDAVDGLVDGLIDDPRRCSLDPETLLCPHGDAPGCLTAQQADTFKKIYAGPTDSKGVQLFPGLPVGGETDEWTVWLLNTPDWTSFGFTLQDQFLRYLAFRVDDPNFDWATFNFDTDPQRMRFMAGLLNATSTDLSGFRKAGGKLLLYHGWSDPIIAATRTIDYYEGVRREIGPKKTKQFARLFMAPGMSHCGSGSGPYAFDYLTALEGWVEQGIAPDSMVAYHFDENGVDRSRPLCAYPQVARYTGHGSIDDAANFRCVEPDSDPD
jgi:feruloyl esterase